MPHLPLDYPAGRRVSARPPCPRMHDPDHFLQAADRLEGQSICRNLTPAANRAPCPPGRSRHQTTSPTATDRGQGHSPPPQAARQGAVCASIRIRIVERLGRARRDSRPSPPWLKLVSVAACSSAALNGAHSSRTLHATRPSRRFSVCDVIRDACALPERRPAVPCPLKEPFNKRHARPPSLANHLKKLRPISPGAAAGASIA